MVWEPGVFVYFQIIWFFFFRIGWFSNCLIHLLLIILGLFSIAKVIMETKFWKWNQSKSSCKILRQINQSWFLNFSKTLRSIWFQILDNVSKSLSMLQIEEYWKWYFVTKILRKNCASDWEKLLKFDAEGQEFAKCLRSLEQFIQTVKSQNNFW